MALNETQYAEALIERIKIVIKFSGLEIPGFAEFTGISESHLYAILNGNRVVSGDIADRISNPFGLKGWQLLRLDIDISKKLKRTPELNKFYVEYRGVRDYFRNTKSEIKSSKYIENVLLQSGFFKTPVYISEIREACEQAGNKLSSKRVSQILNYLVYKGLLKKKKKRIKLKNGQYGDRLVDVFFK